MSSTNKTSLGLNMWEASDKPVRQDFVNDNTIIDEKITQLNSNLNNINGSLNNVNSNLNNQTITSSGLSLTWGSIITGGYTVVGNVVIVNIRVVPNTSLSAGTIYTISGFPLPHALTLNAISVSSARIDLTQVIYLDVSGNIAFTPGATVTSGTALLFSAFYIK